MCKKATLQGQSQSLQSLSSSQEVFVLIFIARSFVLKSRKILESGNCHYPTAATKCNMQRGNPTMNKRHLVQSLSYPNRCLLRYYTCIPSVFLLPENGKPHLHIIKLYTNITIVLFLMVLLYNTAKSLLFKSRIGHLLRNRQFFHFISLSYKSLVMLCKKYISCMK